MSHKKFPPTFFNNLLVFNKAIDSISTDPFKGTVP